jgi:hypothetical protein
LNRTRREDFLPDRLEMFWWFITERQRIWERRFVQRRPRPWTTNEVLQTNRFTNIYRELDPGTQYAIREILEKDEPRADKVFNLMLYRLIGRSETHAFVGFQRLSDFSAKRLESRLKQLRDEIGKPVFTAAYMVSGYTSMGTRDKVTNVVRLFERIHSRFDDLMAALDDARSPEEAYRVLRTAQGLGTFLAYQVLVDLLYPLKSNHGKGLLPFSHEDWAEAGPGARAGIRMLLRSSTSPDHLSVMRWLRDNQDVELARLGLTFPFLKTESGIPIKITLANIQNSLCEFHKFVKITDGTGRGRRKFVPVTRPTKQPSLNAFAGLQ